MLGFVGVHQNLRIGNPRIHSEEEKSARGCADVFGLYYIYAILTAVQAKTFLLFQYFAVRGVLP